jgi:hypothetical protein
MEENKEVAEDATQDPVEETTQQEPVYNEDGDRKIDLTPPPKTPQENETTETPEATDDNVVDEGVVGVDEDANAPQEQEEVHEEVEAQEEIVDIPENVQKLMDFMQDTGGDLNDYVKLNTDIKDMDDSEVLADYYKTTKPHLNGKEINFLLEDNFSFDEEIDDEKEVMRKKLALKEQVAEARTHLEESKSKYYEEIKAGSKLTSEQKEAIDFANKYNQENKQNTDIIKLQQSTFQDKTKKVFNKNFDGFEFNIGDQKMTYNIQDVEGVQDKQLDINNFVGKFLNDKALMEDAAGYHKGLFTAMNPDAVAKHFYEQGKTDAIKQTVADSKNINTSRASHKVYEGDNGVKFKVLGDNANDMKLRVKKRR